MLTGRRCSDWQSNAIVGRERVCNIRSRRSGVVWIFEGCGARAKVQQADQGKDGRKSDAAIQRV
jgi:hypothetical protein